MRKSISAFAALLFLLINLSACMKSEETDYSEYRECAITAFALQNITWDVTTEASDGSDSTYSKTVTASSYDFTIDQEKGLIYNPDSLPAGTKITKVLVNITADGNAYYHKDGESGFTALSGDSVDFTNDVDVTVFSYSGEYSRKYTLHVNVHQLEGDSTQWFQNKVAWAGKEMKAPRAVTFGDKVAVFGLLNGKLMTTVAAQGSMTWENPVELSGVTSAAKYDNIITYQNSLYMLDDEKLYVSDDAIHWTQAQTNTPLQQLFGCDSNHLFAVSNNNFVLSSDAIAWSKTQTEDAAYIPDKNIFCYTLPTTTNPEIQRSVTFGQLAESTDTIASAWYCTSGTQADYSHLWAYAYPSRSNTWALPNLKNLVVLYYKSYFIAFGNDCLNEGEKTAFDQMYVSKDYGLTWKGQDEENYDVYPELPEALEGNQREFAAYVDKNYNIWILCCGTGDIWCGYLNKMKFEE